MLFSSFSGRFHNPAKEPALGYNVVLPVDDGTQLSVVQYRNKLYEVLTAVDCRCLVTREALHGGGVMLTQ